MGSFPNISVTGATFPTVKYYNLLLVSEQYVISDIYLCKYRSPVKEWQVSWFVFGTITSNGTDTTVKRLDRNVKTFSADSSAIFANNGVCAIQSYCPQNKPADLPLFYWRPVCTVYTTPAQSLSACKHVHRLPVAPSRSQTYPRVCMYVCTVGTSNTLAQCRYIDCGRQQNTVISTVKVATVAPRRSPAAMSDGRQFTN